MLEKQHVAAAVPMRVLVVDDEPLARAAVRLLLSDEPDVEVVGQAEDGVGAVEAMRALEPDVVVLDVQIPELNAFEVLDRLESPPLVIFLTAFAQYAVGAFDVRAVDYVLKPVDEERFREAVSRARVALRAREQEADGAPRAHLSRFTVREGGRVRVIPATEVVWVEAADYYARLHTSDGRSQLVRQALSALAEELDPDRFVRVHRSAIVSIDVVKQVGSTGVVLRDGTRVRLSRQGRARLMERLRARR